MKTRKRQRNSAKWTNTTKAPGDGPPATQEIRQRAQEIFMARGGAPGMELDDWLLAERELKHCTRQSEHRLISISYERNFT